MLTFCVLTLSYLYCVSACYKEDSYTCCADYVLKDGQCVDCPSGTFGPSCAFKCQYPKYGRRCLGGRCNCSETFCDPDSGCECPNGNEGFYCNESTSTTTQEEQNQVNKPTTLSLKTYSTTLSTKKMESKSRKTIENPVESQSSVSENLTKTNNTPGITVIVIIIVGSLVIFLLLVVIAFQVRSKLHKQKNKPNLREPITTARDTATYCEIDEYREIPDRLTVDVEHECHMNPYETILSKEKTPYSSLSTKRTKSNTNSSLDTCTSQNESKNVPEVNGEEDKGEDLQPELKETSAPTRQSRADCNSYLSPLPKLDLPTNSVAFGDSCTKAMEDILLKSSTSPVQMRKANRKKLNVRIAENGPESKAAISGYIDMDKSQNKQEYVSMETPPVIAEKMKSAEK